MTLEDLQAEQRTAAQELADLTRRQREVLTLAAKGMQNHQIGEAMGLSLRTIEQHRSALQQRLDMTFIEAVVLATRARWV